MKAAAGDHIIVAAPTTGGTVRDGEIIEVHGANGGPPYLIRWAQGGDTGLFFPGSDAHIAAEPGGMPPAAQQSAAARTPNLRSWRVNVDLVEAGDATTAHAVLVAEAARQLDGQGVAHRNPSDQPAPEIGDEIAVARALRRLADRMLEAAAADIELAKRTPRTSDS